MAEYSMLSGGYEDKNWRGLWPVQEDARPAEVYERDIVSEGRDEGVAVGWAAQFLQQVREQRHGGWRWWQWRFS